MRAIGLLLLLAGCRQLLGFENPTVGPAPDDAAVDMPPPDAAACISTESSCAGDTLRECPAIGQFPVETACGWGCIDDVAMGPHCGVLSPRGDLINPNDLVDDPNLQDIVAAAGITIDTDSGAITGGVTRAAGPGIHDGIDFQTRGNIAVFRVKSFDFGTTVTITGSHGFALVATTGDIAIGGVLDLTAECTSMNRTPGGSQGGSGQQNGQGQGGGDRGNRSGGGNSSYTGGGGAGFGEDGGPGGDGLQGQGGSAGNSYGNLALQVMGGSGGGGGAANQASEGGRGGTGGGAIQLVSNTRIAIATGIDAGGCGGRIGFNADSSGGGGGSGGAIVLVAPVITIDGGIAVNGGGGASGGTAGTSGEHGQLGSTTTGGGQNMLAGDGGSGGAGGLVVGAAGETDMRAGGGGGGVGRILLETKSGNATITGFTSPALDTSGPATQTQATVQ